jgi:pilus assembly protein FimV
VLEAYKLIAQSYRRRKTAIAAAALAVLALSAPSAWSLSLGRVTVQSALGEPLRAEIDVPEINAEEAASLRTVIASPDAFVAAGLEYNPAMPGLQLSLQRRADGRAYIRLSSDRAINDPFIDMILEASWSSGRIVRDYTMLFDPPALRPSSAPNPTLSQITPAPAPAAPLRSFASPPAAAVAPDPVRSPPASKPAPIPAPAARPAPAADPDAGRQVLVKAGDTASKIAANNKSASVSLDQMLVALLRSSPEAFIDGNINRIRAGAVVQIPSSEQALSVSPTEATRVLATQSKNFNSFRSTLATNAPAAAVSAADRSASGKVQAKVEDKKPSAATPDKLTLSKGGVQAKEAESRIARERADKEAAARAAEIAKNISDLKKASAAIAPASAPAASAAPSPAASKPGIAVAASASVPPAVVASAPSPAASAASSPAPAVAPIPMEEPGFLDDMFEDPLIPAAGAGLLALLGGGLFYYRKRQKKGSNQVDSSFIESRLQPDSFFGASGGQRVDTSSDGPASGSSMVYSPSQLDAADDVDPVAEADVYMAYGRDLQAEEILKEAVRTNPGRLAIHTKLMEIFAKRRDARSFEASATQAFKLTGNNSPDWTRICELGLSIDPANPLYQPGGTPANMDGPALASAAVASQFGATVAQSAHPELTAAAPGAMDLDLDLDFSLDDEPASAISDLTGSTLPPSATEPTVKMQAPALAASPASDDNSLDFDLSGPGELTSSPAAPDLPDLPDVPVSMDGLSMPGADDMALPDLEPPTAQIPAPTPEPVKKDEGMLEFDMGSLSLDLDPPAPAASAPIEPALLPDIEMSTQAPDSTGEDPLETKLALADEFVSIGDEDGARALIEEVMAEATGEMRAKAQRALANLG